jgi:Major Facilitator Superfamily
MQRDGMHNRTFEGKRERSGLVTLVLGLGIFLVPFDVTVVVVALPGIAKDLYFSVGGAAWIIDAYSLAFTGALLASGALADRFGRRRSMLAGNAVFLLASIACGVAANGRMLLAARAVLPSFCSRRSLSRIELPKRGAHAELRMDIFRSCFYDITVQSHSHDGYRELL